MAAIPARDVSSNCWNHVINGKPEVARTLLWRRKDSVPERKTEVLARYVLEVVKVALGKDLGLNCLEPNS